MNREWLYGVLLVTGSALLLSTGSFGAMSAERPVDIRVADDDRAFVGYEIACTDGVASVTVTNRFEQDLSSGTVTIGEVQRQTGVVDDSVTLSFTRFQPDDPVTVRVVGQDAEATLRRSVPSRCEKPTIASVQFTGAGGGNVFLERTDTDRTTFTVTYWRLSDGTLSAETIEFEHARERIDLRRVLPGGNGEFAAVYVESTDTTYVHQRLEYEGGSWTITDGRGSNQPTDRTCRGLVDFETSTDAPDCGDS